MPEIDFDVVLESVRRRFDALEALIEAASQGHSELHDEIDTRYEQRFHAQEKAVELALARVDKEFHEHLQQVRAETKAALDAADKAIQKSEVSTEKRFESVNEFRAQLADQARNLMPRSESEQRMSQNSEKIATLEQRLNAAVAQINSRLDVSQGKESGVNAAWAFAVAGIGALGGMVGIILAVAR